MFIRIYTAILDKKDELVAAAEKMFSGELVHTVEDANGKVDIYLHIHDFEEALKFVQWLQVQLLGAAFVKKAEEFEALRSLPEIKGFK